MKKQATPTMMESAENISYTPALVKGARSKRQSLAQKPPPSRLPKSKGSNGDYESELSAEEILSALVAFKKGDFSVRLPLTWTGVSGKVADAFNEVAELMSHQTEDLSRISRVVGKEGRIQERLSL